MQRHAVFLLCLLLTVSAAGAEFSIDVENASPQSLQIDTSYPTTYPAPVELVCSISNGLSPSVFSADRDEMSTVDAGKAAWQCRNKRWESLGVIGCTIAPATEASSPVPSDITCSDCQFAPQFGMSVETCRQYACTDTTNTGTVAYTRAENLTCGLRYWEDKDGTYHAVDTFASTPLVRGSISTAAVAPNRQYRGHTVNVTCTVENTGNTPLFGEDKPGTIQYQIQPRVRNQKLSLRTRETITRGTTTNLTVPVTIPPNTAPGKTSVSCGQLLFNNTVLDTAHSQLLTVTVPPVAVTAVQARKQGTINTSTVTPFTTVVVEGQLKHNRGETPNTVLRIRRGNTITHQRNVTVRDGTFRTTYTPGQNTLPGTYTAEITSETRGFSTSRKSTFIVQPSGSSTNLTLEWVDFPPSTMQDSFHAEFKLLRGSTVVPASYIRNVSCGLLNETSGQLMTPVEMNRTNRDTYEATYHAPQGVREGFFACDITLATGEQTRKQEAYISGSVLPLLVGGAAFLLLVLGMLVYGGTKLWGGGVTREEKIKDVERKLESIRNAKKEAQRKYFTRSLDEDTFTEMMQEYKENEMQLEEELAALKKEEERQEDTS